MRILILLYNYNYCFRFEFHYKKKELWIFLSLDCAACIDVRTVQFLRFTNFEYKLQKTKH